MFHAEGTGEYLKTGTCLVLFNSTAGVSEGRSEVCVLVCVRACACVYESVWTGMLTDH